MIDNGLVDFTAEKLFDLAYYRQYPIHPGKAKWSFLQTLKNLDVEVVCNDETKEVALITGIKFSLNGQHQILNVIPYSDLGFGSGVYTKDSLKAFEDSVYNLWQPQEELPDNLLKLFRQKGDEKIKMFKEQMKEFILPYFQEHQEQMLIPASGQIPDLRNSRRSILEAIVSKYPQIKPGRIFWGIYLDELCNRNEYGLKDENGDRYQKLMNEGTLALQDGRVIFL